MFVITLALYAFGIYLVIGLIFSLWFVFKGARQLDENLSGASISVRLLLIPGSIALWPLLLYKIVKK
jgi:glycerol-3-phosphate acyltransferase PlsY